MNRCLPLPITRFVTMLVAVLIWTSNVNPVPAVAQSMLRQFPAATKRGVLVVTAPPDILIDGSPARLSPGARIKSANNLLVLSATLVGSSVPVRYVRDGQGLVHEVWILSAQEAQAN